MKASDLFKGEYSFFPELSKFDLSKMDAEFILTLQHFRINYKIPMTPSPLERAWYREEPEDKYSRHYAVDRLSDAGDLFPKLKKAYTCWNHAIRCGLFNGIGLYLDTHFHNKPWPMLHLDTRPGDKVIWFRDEGVYYPYEDRENFQRLVKKFVEMV